MLHMKAARVWDNIDSNHLTAIENHGCMIFSLTKTLGKN